MFSFLRPKKEMSRREIVRAKFLEDVIPKNSVGAELGVYKGEFTKLILEIARPRRLHLIDPWWLLGKKEWAWAKGNKSIIEAFVNVIRSFEEELIAGQVIINIGFDLEILPSFPDDYFDWVYLDTTHDYEHTKQELDLLKEKVKDDGLITGDDWHPDPDHRHHGVYEAVNEFTQRNPYEIVYLSDEFGQWCIRRKQ